MARGVIRLIEQILTSFTTVHLIGIWVGDGTMRHSRLGVGPFGGIITIRGTLHMALITIHTIIHTVLVGGIVVTIGAVGIIRIRIGIEDISMVTFIVMRQPILD